MKTGQKFEKFIEIVKKLRQECPWDREQTIESLKPYLVEEVYEALQAIDDKDYKKLSGEVGDMLLHVVMLSVFAAETRKFDIDKVIDQIASKMVRRHPHVFGGKKAKNKGEVWRRWEIIKRNELKKKAEEEKGMLTGVPRSLPALYRADKIQRRAARVGFDWDQVAGAWEKVYEELGEIHAVLTGDGRRSKVAGRRIKEEIGDLLFAVTNVARKLGLDAEEALQGANNKFIRRFSKIEKALQKKKLSIRQMDALWERAKLSE